MAEAKHEAEPWWKHWGALAAGIFFIGLAVAYGVGAFALPQMGIGIGNFFAGIGIGFATAANAIQVHPRTLWFILGASILAIGGSIAAVKYWMKDDPPAAH